MDEVSAMVALAHRRMGTDGIARSVKRWRAIVRVWFCGVRCPATGTRCTSNCTGLRDCYPLMDDEMERGSDRASQAEQCEASSIPASALSARVGNPQGCGSASAMPVPVKARPRFVCEKETV